MAQAIACDLCGQETAVMLETRIETGEVIAVGMSCLIPFYTGAAGSLYDTLDVDDAVAFAPAVLALAAKWALPDDTGTASERGTPRAGDVLTAAEIDWVTDDGGDPDAVATIVAGVEDASVSGKGITVTADQPARRARNRARTPK